MANPIIENAVLLLRQGKKQEAQQALINLIRQEPSNSAAWYGLSFCMDDPQKKIDCLNRTLALNPANEKARALLEKLNAAQTPPSVFTNDTGPAQGSNIPFTVPADNDPKITRNSQPASVDRGGTRQNNFEQRSPKKETTSYYREATSNSDSYISYRDGTDSGEIQTPIYQRSKAGASAREMGDQRKKTAYLIGAGFGLVLVIIAIVFSILAKNLPSGGILSLVGLILMYLIYRTALKKIDNKASEASRAYRGAAAEEIIGELLGGLDENYLVLHDLEYQYGNIDHVVINKDGRIFMIETKSHKGRVSMQGDKLLINKHDPEKDFIAQCLRNTFYLRDTIGPVVGEKPWVTPVLVFTDAFVPYGKPIKGVTIINKKYLLETIQIRNNGESSAPKVWDRRAAITGVLK